MSKQMKATDIIKETVAYYAKNKRAVDITETGESCRYNWGDGSHCAVGRCLDKKYQDMGEDMPGNDQRVGTLLDEFRVSSIDVILQEKYRGHSLDFWTELQELHDFGEFWMDNIHYSEDGSIAGCHKLTAYGEDAFHSLINKYKVQEK